MSQMLESRPKGRMLYSDLHFERPKIQLKSAANEAVCKICKSELREGIGLTAKYIENRIILVCNSHKF